MFNRESAFNWKQVPLPGLDVIREKLPEKEATVPLALVESWYNEVVDIVHGIDENGNYHTSTRREPSILERLLDLRDSMYTNLR